MLKFKFDIGVLITIDFSTNQSRHIQNVIFRGKPQSLGKIPNLSRFLQCFSILIFHSFTYSYFFYTHLIKQLLMKSF